MQKIILLLAILLVSLTSAAQTKTITGYVHNKAGQPLEVNMTLNTPKQDNTHSNPNGSYTLITEDFPTRITNVAQQDNTKIWPNPARTKAHMQLPALEGTLEAYDLNGKLLGKINLSNTDELTFNATNFALIRYVNKNEQSTQKLLIEQGNNTISVQAQSNQEPQTKSGIEETFGYKITFTGENIQDTTIAVENFDKNQTTHNQNHTLDELITKTKNIPDSATTNNNITINLKEYFKNDDETTYNSNDERITFNGDYATIDLTKGNVNATINAQEPGRNIQSNTFNITKYQTINGTLTNIETNEPITNATILGWDGQGNLIYTTTNEKGEYSLPSNGINQIKIIKQGFQTRTTYNETTNNTTINWNIYNKETFPLEAIIELTGNKTLQFKKPPTIYLYKEDKYPQESYDALEKLIHDVDGMSLGHTKNLEIKYITKIEEIPKINDESAFILVNFEDTGNSTWSFGQTSDQKNMNYASIRIFNGGPEQTYYSFSEEFGSAFLGCYNAIGHTQIRSNYTFDANFNTMWYEPVDSTATKYHFTRTNNAQVSTDTEMNTTNMNELDNKQEIRNIYTYQNNTLTKQTYNELPQAIQQEIEQ